MLSEKFSYTAISYGVLCITVLVLTGIFRLRRGKIVGAQFCIALLLVISWIWSNATFIMVDQPTSNDLSYPYLDAVTAGVLILVRTTYKESSIWMRSIMTLTVGSLFFHIPYLMTDGKIISKYAYHLVENMIFLAINVLVVLGLFIKRSVWMKWDAALGRWLRRKLSASLQGLDHIINVGVLDTH
jgi:hypothetical protein